MIYIINCNASVRVNIAVIANQNYFNMLLYKREQYIICI